MMRSTPPKLTVYEAFAKFFMKDRYTIKRIPVKWQFDPILKVTKVKR